MHSTIFGLELTRGTTCSGWKFLGKVVVVVMGPICPFSPSQVSFSDSFECNLLMHD